MFLWSALFTILHHSEEALSVNGGPVWAYLGRIAGVRVPAWAGLTVFTFGLGAGLLALAFWGYTGSAFALSMLLGARAGDVAVTHVLYATLGYRPNPGQLTAALYLAEMVWLTHLLFRSTHDGSWLGIAAGFVGIASAVPVKWLFRR